VILQHDVFIIERSSNYPFYRSYSYEI